MDSCAIISINIIHLGVTVLNKRRWIWLLLPLIFIITGCGLFEADMSEDNNNEQATEQTEEVAPEETADETSENVPVTVYVPDEQAMGMERVEAELPLSEYDSEAQAFEALLSGQTEDNINILPEGTEINNVYLNDNEVAEVDVSEEFTANMNAGSTGELFFVYTLVNTISDYYSTDEVLLTVDGEPYQGAHMALEEGETLNFNEW